MANKLFVISFLHPYIIYGIAYLETNENNSLKETGLLRVTSPIQVVKQCKRVNFIILCNIM